MTAIAILIAAAAVGAGAIVLRGLGKDLRALHRRGKRLADGADAAGVSGAGMISGGSTGTH